MRQEVRVHHQRMDMHDIVLMNAFVRVTTLTIVIGLLKEIARAFILPACPE